ncbi:hypothetical protein NA57DRAFT_12099, partial [Rhizodiscina lignyota]
SLQQVRHYKRSRPNSGTVVPDRNRPPCDEEIGTTRVNLVTSDGRFLPAQPIHQILRTYNRETHTLMQLQAGNPDAPRIEQQHWPVAKIVSHQELRDIDAKKREAIKQQKKTTASSKQMELSWVIGENDLGHRLKKIREFLEEGRKVEITVTTKRGMRAVTEKECAGLVAKLRRILGTVNGAKEYKEPEGSVGKMYMMFWEAKTKKK